jgi:hypothetical protein
MLQAKVGSGDVDSAKRIAKSQAILESEHDGLRAPMADRVSDTRWKPALRDVPEDQVIADVKAEILQPVIVEVMQIKANAAMFNYTLVGNAGQHRAEFSGETCRAGTRTPGTIVDAQRQKPARHRQQRHQGRWRRARASY